MAIQTTRVKGNPGYSPGKPPVIAKGQLAAGESIIIEMSPARGTIFMLLVTGAGATATIRVTMDTGVITLDGLVFTAGVNSAGTFFSPLAANSDILTGQTGPVTGLSLASAGGTLDYTVSQFPRGVTP